MNERILFNPRCFKNVLNIYNEKLLFPNTEMVRDKYKKPQCHWKICQKLKIIALNEEAKIPMRL